MEEKKGFSQQLNDFFAGKGFYIVLLLCAGLIALSIWLMASGSRADVELSGEDTRMETAGVRAAETEPEDALAVMGSAPTRPRTAAPPAGSGGQGPQVQQVELPEPEAPETEGGLNEPAEESAGLIQDVDYFIWPVNGALLRESSVETLSYDPTMRDWRLHTGWDIAAAAGEPVLSTANGVVSAVYEDDMLGATVEVRHSNGLVSVYANLAQEPPVVPGQSVVVGSVLGSVGASALGESGQQSHLHFALRRDGLPVDPADWLPSPD